MKTHVMKRAAVLLLTAALALSVNAAALFGGVEKAQSGAGAPTAQAVEIRTYRGIPYRAQFLAAGSAGETLTYAVEEAPKKGTVQIDGDQLHLHAGGERLRHRSLHLHRHRRLRPGVPARGGDGHH